VLTETVKTAQWAETDPAAEVLPEDGDAAEVENVDIAVELLSEGAVRGHLRKRMVSVKEIFFKFSS